MSDETTGDALIPSVGWGVVHLFLRARRGESAADVLTAVDEFAAVDPQQVLAFSILGGRADFGVMALAPNLTALDVFTKRVLGGPVELVSSFTSLTELSEYATTEEDERARLAAEGAGDVEAKIAEWHERMAAYRENRLHPRLPRRRVLSFYPMSKSRVPGANWFELEFEQRRRLMVGHGRVGRSYHGRVLQLITGATGIDDWEWGVTLLADDVVAIKDIVYEMRFDPASAAYGLFGPFWTGLVMDPADALERSGLTVAA